MALLYSHLPFLDACDRHGLIASPTYVLGSQQFIDADAYRSATGYELPEERVAAALFKHRYGVDRYVTLDLNEDADVQLDLTADLPVEYRGRAATVLESGTLEHIFDIAAALRNVHAMIQPGGAFVALAPVSWWNHGFVNVNPKLFTGLAAANGYELVVEGYWFRARLPGRPGWTRTVLTRDGEVRPRAKLWIDRMLNRALPARILYLVAMRKGEETAFRVPSDVFGDW